MGGRTGRGKAWTPEEDEWLRRNYPRRADCRTIPDALEARFGVRRSLQAVYVHANKLGLRKKPQDRMQRASRPVFWSREPEMEAWMLEHDGGRPVSEVSADFEREFGFPLSRPQVSLFRSSHGVQARRSHGGGRPASPVGSERVTKDGRVLVKVREHADVPQSKDNWEFAHHIAYREAYGEIPDGWMVMLADHDPRNLDPANLVACPKDVIGVMNELGYSWHDRESLLACIAAARLKRGIASAERRVTRRCQVCGATFEMGDGSNRRTCPSCLAAGLKAKGERDAGRGVCSVCGAEFTKSVSTQRRCQACIGEGRKA